MTTFSDIIREAAEKHNITIGKDDPIAVLWLVNEHLLNDTATAQQQNLGDFERKLEVLSLKWSGDVHKQITAALEKNLSDYQEKLTASARSAVESAPATLRHEIDAVAASLKTLSRDNRNLALMNLAAAVMVIVAALAVLLG